MITDLQKASVWKRIAAGIFDGILLCILAVGFAWLLTAALDYNSYNASLEQAYDRYEAQYGVEFQITQKEYEALSQEEQKNYDAAYQALTADEDVLYTYNMLINLTMLITTFGILLSVLVLEFLVPLWLKNGQTIGKKIFGIGLIRTDGIRMSNIQLFARTILGKFTIELMIPVYILIMIFFNTIGTVGVLVLGAILLGEIICMAVTKTNSLLHDVLAGTVAVDLSSQMIFESVEDQIEYTKKIHAEQVSRSDYK